ncbi:rubrerythrin family protein [Halobacteriales archaeon QS_8_69_26]|nr:MAG: rubrerythrin family protein [Halobacteriales archaeon QS_8_69_26]
MDASDLVDEVRDERETELSRLGSSKSLFAATGGEMDADAVLAAAADVAAGARDAYRGWADDEDHGDAAALFADVADAEADRYETIAGELDDHDPDPPRVYDHLDGLDGTAERIGGLLGETLVTDAHLGQVVGFFVGDADPRTASTFRGMGDDVEDRLDRVLDLADGALDGDEFERALAAADGVVGAAYDEYVDSLETQGVNPKPVC